MSEGFKIRRSGGVASGGSLFAAIGVKYPEGSTCTCTGKTTGKVFRAKDTTGMVVFAVPEADTWTVKISKTVDGVETSKEVDVEINDEVRCINVEISYSFVLFAAGKNLASGYSYESLGNAANTVNDDAITIGDSTQQRQTVFITPAVDCTNFSKITVVGMQTDADIAGAMSTLTVGLTKTTELTSDYNGSTDVPQFVEGATAVFNKDDLNNEQTLEVDLSDVEGNCYLCICAYYHAPGKITSIVFS